MANDKARPVQERIAALFGRTSYADPREPAGTSPAAIRHSDVAAALGYVAITKGKLAAEVLETHYGSTLVHERHILQCWESAAGIERGDFAAVVLTRFTGALAIRQLAGMTYNSTHYTEYAYLLYSRREAIQIRVDGARRWLQRIHDDALGEFRRQLHEEASARELRRAAKEQRRAA